jgi:hypothetical protein
MSSRLFCIKVETQELFFFWKGSSCAAHALSKKGTRDVLPLTAEGRTATQQLPSCCR